MPQLNPGVFPMQLFWLAITFGFLFVLMAKVALPRLSRILDARSHRIDGDIAAAKTARTEAEALGTTIENHLNAAKTAAAAELKRVEETVLAEARRREAELTQKLTAETAAAETRILAAKAGAMVDIRKLAAEMAQAAAVKLLQMPISETQAREAVADIGARTEGGRA